MTNRKDTENSFENRRRFLAHLQVGQPEPRHQLAKAGPGFHRGRKKAFFVFFKNRNKKAFSFFSTNTSQKKRFRAAFQSFQETPFRDLQPCRLEQQVRPFDDGLERS
jgi:hypothetical protein